MKSAIIFTAAIALAQAINLQQEEGAQNAPEMLEGDERTIIGFLFEGFDFGELWTGLTDEQREEIKTSVFAKTLEFGGYVAANFPDQDFIMEDKPIEKSEDIAPVDESVLAQCHRHGHGRWGGRFGGWGGFGCGGCGPCFPPICGPPCGPPPCGPWGGWGGFGCGCGPAAYFW